jgi:hypothetical protein
LPRISTYFGLTRTQPSLDFVDIDFDTDLEVFVDPRALRLIHTEWGEECVALIQDFFTAVLQCIQRGDDDTARHLLLELREPNETHLGFSAARSRGRALGNSSAADVWGALRASEAAQSGLLEDLEDTVLLVDGISTDIVSDIATNLIRQPLIHYTHTACAWYGIPLQPGVASGPMWDPARQEWFNEFTELPTTPEGKLLLVPKAIVRRRLTYDADEYYRDYILEYLRARELSANTDLVKTFRDGRVKVTRKALEEKYGRGKALNRRVTIADPSVLTNYRLAKLSAVRPPLTHDELAEDEGTAAPDWVSLLDAVLSLPTGTQDAPSYERACEALLSALFYPALANPQPQHKIHEGRKRIDITYDNIATSGLFSWVAQHYPAPCIFVECKNYTQDPGNPELDQLSGRFSPNRGQVGLLICRSFSDKALFAQRCKDTAVDARGFIVHLDDDDLRVLVRDRAASAPADQLRFELLRARFHDLIS